MVKKNMIQKRLKQNWYSEMPIHRPRLYHWQLFIPLKKVINEICANEIKVEKKKFTEIKFREKELYARITGVSETNSSVADFINRIQNKLNSLRFNISVNLEYIERDNTKDLMLFG